MFIKTFDLLSRLFSEIYFSKITEDFNKKKILVLTYRNMHTVLSCL